jgi:hypothetical protein
MTITSDLNVSIPDENAFYSLYADGPTLSKFYDKHNKVTVITYGADAVVVLYYTYPAHREACVVRNTAGGQISLPGLSKKITMLFSVQASCVDKLKRAVGYINTNCRPNAFSRGNGFYIRLYYLLLQRGKLNYFALKNLTEANND